MTPVKKGAAKAPKKPTAYQRAVADALEGPPSEEDVKASKRITVDYESAMAASAEDDDYGVDAEVVIPNFVLDGNGQLVYAEDQDDALVLRLAPTLTASALGVIASYRDGANLLALPSTFEMLLHMDDVRAWRNRMFDASRPVPSLWIAKAVRGMLAEHGLIVEDAPGKSGS